MQPEGELLPAEAQVPGFCSELLHALLQPGAVFVAVADANGRQRNPPTDDAPVPAPPTPPPPPVVESLMGPGPFSPDEVTRARGRSQWTLIQCHRCRWHSGDNPPPEFEGGDRPRRQTPPQLCVAVIAVRERRGKGKVRPVTARGRDAADEAKEGGAKSVGCPKSGDASSGVVVSGRRGIGRISGWPCALTEAASRSWRRWGRSRRDDGAACPPLLTLLRRIIQ